MWNVRLSIKGKMHYWAKVQRMARKSTHGGAGVRCKMFVEIWPKNSSKARLIKTIRKIPIIANNQLLVLDLPKLFDIYCHCVYCNKQGVLKNLQMNLLMRAMLFL